MDELEVLTHSLTPRRFSREEAIILLRQGLRFREVADRLGVTHQAISAACHSRQWGLALRRAAEEGAARRAAEREARKHRQRPGVDTLQLKAAEQRRAEIKAAVEERVRETTRLSSGVLKRRFGNRSWPIDAVLNQIEEFHRVHRRAPKAADFAARRGDLPSLGSVRLRFGGLREVLCLSSLPTEAILHALRPPHPARNYSDEYLLGLLRLCDAAGIRTSKDYLTAGLAPTPAIFFARFGSWNRARQLALLGCSQDTCKSGNGPRTAVDG